MRGRSFVSALCVALTACGGGGDVARDTPVTVAAASSATPPSDTPGATAATVPSVASCSLPAAPAGARVLVFSRTTAFRHASIPVAAAAIQALGAKHGFAVDATEDPSRFSEDGLRPYTVVLFLSTTGDVLAGAQQAALERWVRAGGGFVGIHAAADTEYEWPWFGRLVGAWFRSHPAIAQATVNVVDRTHVSTKCLPEKWVRTDEWYDFRERPAGGATVLATLDETTYQGGTMGAPHPIAWWQAFEGGRSWYTGGGHTDESWREPAFLDHVAGGILWAAGAR